MIFIIIFAQKLELVQIKLDLRYGLRCRNAQEFLFELWCGR